MTYKNDIEREFSLVEEREIGLLYVELCVAEPCLGAFIVLQEQVLFERKYETNLCRQCGYNVAPVFVFIR